MNGFLFTLARSLGSLFGSFVLAGFVVGYMSLPKRTFVGFKKWNIITLIVSIAAIAWEIFKN